MSDHFSLKRSPAGARWCPAWVVTAVALLFATTFSASARDLLLRVLSSESGYPKGRVYLHSAGGDLGVELKVQKFLSSSQQEVSIKGSTLILTNNPDPESVKVGEAIIGRFKVPSSCDSGIVILKAPANEGQSEARFVDDSAKAFPPGTFLIANLSESTVRIELEGKNFACEAGQFLRITDPPVNDRNASVMRAFKDSDGEWEQISSGAWPHPGSKRVLQVAAFDTRRKTVVIQGFRDIAELE